HFDDGVAFALASAGEKQSMIRGKSLSQLAPKTPGKLPPHGTFTHVNDTITNIVKARSPKE
ncbi:MAG: hypothetical protein WAK25_19325, partial [Acidobacteriaceae bacterium]